MHRLETFGVMVRAFRKISAQLNLQVFFLHVVRVISVNVREWTATALGSFKIFKPRTVAPVAVAFLATKAQNKYRSLNQSPLSFL